MKYYSETLNKFFDTEKEVIEAEKYAEEKAEAEKRLEEQRKKERTKEAKEIEEALEAVRKAEDVYHKKLNAFIKKYGYYHCSFKDVTDVPSIFSLFKPFF